MGTVADRLVWLIKDLGTSERALALDADLGHSTVTKILRRTEEDPSYEPDRKTLRILASRYGVSYLWLADGVGEARPRELAPGEAPEPHVSALMDHQPEPVLGALPNWSALRAAALELDASVKPWSLDFLAGRSPMLVGELTPLALVELAHVVQRHMLRPSAPGQQPVAKPSRKRPAGKTPLEKMAEKKA